LPSSEVYHVYQDSKGFIWFATNMGVSRYDGYSFTHYGIEHGLPDNTIFEIYEDYKGRIWFVSYSLRLSYFHNDSIHNYKYNQNISDYFSRNRVSRKMSFYVDSTDNIFMGIESYGGIKIDSKGSIEKLVPIDSEAFEVINLGKKVIVAPSDGYYKKIHLRNKENIYEVIEMESIMRKHIVNSQFVIKKDSVLIASISKCLYKFVNNKFVEKRCFEDGIIWMNTDSRGNLLIGKHRGAYVFDSLNINNITDSLLLDYSVTSIMKDKEGAYWFSTLSSGVYYLSNIGLKTLTKENKLRSNNIQKLCKDKKNNVWLAYENKGVDKLTHGGNLHKYSILQKNERYSQGPDGVYDLLYDSTTNKIFLCRWNGIYYKKLSLENTNFTLYKNILVKEIEALSNDTIVAVLHSGIRKYLNGKTVYKSTDDNFYYSLDEIYIDEDNSYYLGGLNGLWKYQNGQYKHQGKKDDRFYYRITEIGRMNEDFMLMGTRGGGLLAVSKDTIFQITEEDGLLNNAIKTFKFDDDKIWVVTNKGLSRITYYDFNANLYSIYNLTKINGLPTSEINDIEIRDSLIYLATSKGLTYFGYNDLKINDYPPPIYIQNIAINGTDTTIQKNFNLSPKENFISINYKGLCYRSNGDVTYRYKMEGLDNKWVKTKRTYKSFTTLPPGDYKFLVSARNEDGIWSKEPAKISFHIAKPLTSQWWFIVLIIVVIVSVVYILFNLRMRIIHRRNELIQDINSYKQQILRQQMNPHFIFNTLNSIQYFLLDEDTTSSLTYLAKFAKLMRIILDNSQHTFISIEDEIRGLELYLELESLRFEKSFDYEVTIDKDVNSFNYKIPALLLQPYVENSIRHGLLHKKDKGYLKVHIKKHEKALFCLIEDNGIGRKKSEEIKMKKGPMTKSLGSKITEDRINILNSLYSDEIDVHYHDLKDDQGVPHGTRVEIKLPFVV
jgi:ligand-binding sensor domain-containing protein